MRRLFIIGLVIIATTSCVSKDKYEDLEYQNQMLQNRIDELESYNYELESRNYELENEVSDLEYRLEKTEKKLKNAEDIINEAKRTCLIWDDDTFMVSSVLNRYW